MRTMDAGVLVQILRRLESGQFFSFQIEIAKKAKPRFLLRDEGQGIEQVACAAGQAVQAGD